MNKPQILFVIILLLITLSFCTGQDKTPVDKDLSWEQLDAKLKAGDDFLLVDVRTTEEYSSGHIPGALNVPLSAAMDGFPTEDKNALIVVYCRSGNRSSQAQQILQEKGYIKVINFGGISKWQGALVVGSNPK